MASGSTTSNSASSCNSGGGGMAASANQAGGGATSSSNNNNNNTCTSGSGGGGGTPQQQACAACKFQRRKCSAECPLAPYFPPDQPKQFLNVHKLYGVSNTLRILKQVQPSKRNDAMKSILYEADARDRDPVHGCLGIITFLHTQAQLLRDELDFVRSQIHLLEHAHLQLAAAAAAPPPASSPSLYPLIMSPSLQQQQPLHHHPFLIPSELQLASPSSTIHAAAAAAAASASPDSTSSAAYLHAAAPSGSPVHGFVHHQLHPLNQNAFAGGGLQLHCGSPPPNAMPGGEPPQLLLGNAHFQQTPEPSCWQQPQPQQQLSPGSAQVNGWLSYHQFGGGGTHQPLPQPPPAQQHSLPQLLPGTPTNGSAAHSTKHQFRNPTSNLIDVRPSFDTRSLADYEPLAQLHSYHDSAPKTETAYESSAESSIKDQNSLEHDELESAAALFALTSGQSN